jgi:hypothetical protein
VAAEAAGMSLRSHRDAKVASEAATVGWRIEGGVSAEGSAGEGRRREPWWKAAEKPWANFAQVSRDESKRTLKPPACLVDAAEQQPVTPQFSTWT